MAYVAEKQPPIWLQMRNAGYQAGHILTHFGISRPAIDVLSVARGLEVQLYMSNDPRFLGAIQSTDESATLWFDMHDQPKRQRFTIAHELGHLMLHPLGVLFRDQTFGGSEMEQQANAFAADLLMPKAMLQADVYRYGADSSVLADLYAVSLTAMKIRLQAMGIPFR